MPARAGAPEICVVPRAQEPTAVARRRHVGGDDRDQRHRCAASTTRDRGGRRAHAEAHGAGAGGTAMSNDDIVRAMQALTIVPEDRRRAGERRTGHARESSRRVNLAACPSPDIWSEALYAARFAGILL